MASERPFAPAPAAWRIRLRGTTQGVGLRPWIHRLAGELGVTGRATNTSDGVEIDAWGAATALECLLQRLREAPGAAVDAIVQEPLPPEAAARAPEGFRLDARPSPDPQTLPLAPDLAACPHCLREVDDPADRRHRYAFTSCTACGPRFTIARSLPWERARTSMADFPMCPDCAREHATPQGRRHHAEANACPRCGPQLRFVAGADAREIPGDAALEAALRALRHGAILAVRGVGGYHLVCDACDPDVVERLRKRKRRPRKPFAVMVSDLATARALAHVDDAEAALLESPEAPIVLLRRRAGTALSEAVAPGLPWVGLLLAYTPLHRLLCAGVARPLVATSANPSGEPIVFRHEDAGRLSHLVDGFLHHDREITTPCDDSVARVIAGRSVLLRRSRGFVPRPLVLPAALPAPVLGCGAQLASTVCLGVGARAWPSAHLGDHGSPETADAWEAAVARLERWLDVRAEVVAHDLHPGYASTLLARARAAALHVAVQHHHAHVASAIVEHRLEGPVVGVAFDGTGLGTDGSAWGGEILLADAAGFERLATLRPIALAGGDTAIREVWRIALAVLLDAFDDAPPLDALPLFRGLPAERVEAVGALIRRGAGCVAAHGAGRWFDALGALGLDRTTSAHSGDVATHWNAVADPGERRPYPFDLRPPDRRDAPDAPRLEIDLRPLVRAAVRDRLAGRGAAEISGRFHATLAEAIAAVLTRLRAGLRGRPVVLTGGCFANPRLAAEVRAALVPRWRVHWHERVPPGDGGIAPGQLWVAAAVARAGGPAVGG